MSEAGFGKAGKPKVFKKFGDTTKLRYVFDRDDYHNVGMGDGVNDDGQNVSTRCQPQFKAEIVNPNLIKLDPKAASYEEIQKEKLKDLQ